MFTISDVAMEALLLTSLTVPLTMLTGSDTFGALDDGTRHALGYLGVRLFFTGWNFALLLFSGFCGLTGLLILRSRRIPREIGALMIGRALPRALAHLQRSVACDGK